MASAAQRIDVDDFLDGLRFGRFHILVLIVCTLLTAIDGYELYVVGWVLPDLARDFGVAPTAITSAMVAQQVGMLVGAFVVPPLADRIGRPRVLLLCYAGMTLSAFAILATKSLLPFTVCRLLAGFCASAMIPILVTIASETAPRRLRATMSATTISGTMIGSGFGALMQGFVLEPFGWRGAFWIACLLPGVMLPLIYFALPDSLRSLVARNPEDPGIAALVRRLQPADAEPPLLTAPPRPARAAGAVLFADILGPGQLLRTLLLWALTMSSFVFITAGVWKTTIFKNVIGLSWQNVALVNGTNTVAGFVGMVCIGLFIDRLGFKTVIVATFFLAALGCALIGALAPGIGMFLAVAVMALFQHGGQAGIAALAASLYPPRSRATGVGWAYGAGRIASIFAPLFGTYVLSNGFGATGIFVMLAVPLASAGLFSWWLMSLRGAGPVTRAGHGVEVLQERPA